MSYSLKKNPTMEIIRFFWLRYMVFDHNIFGGYG